MPRDDLAKRIEALNKRPLKNVPESDSAQMRALKRKLQKRVTSSPPALDPFEKAVPSRKPENAKTRNGSLSTSVDFGPAVVLEEVVKGAVTQAPAGPGYYLIEQHAELLEAQAGNVYARFASLTGHPDGQAVQRIAHACKSERVAPEEVVFLDLETTGLGGMTPVFLVGTMECIDGRFVFRQYFARDYSEEASIVSAVAARFKDVGLLVTFNGKSFDMPFLQNRAVATGVALDQPESHLDLLHEARRVYRDQLPNCRLQTLEATICGRERDDDIPGSEIPTAYHDYVRSGNANKIGVILRHNLYDLLTMADLMNRMWWRE